MIFCCTNFQKILRKFLENSGTHSEKIPKNSSKFWKFFVIFYFIFSKAKCFSWNTNNKLGDIRGRQKTYLGCDFKPNCPFRIIACGSVYSTLI